MKNPQKFNKPIQHEIHNINHHIANIYSSLFAAPSCVIAGLIAHFIEFDLGLLTVYIFFGLLSALYFLEHNAKNSLLRYRLLLGLGFFFGQLLGPILSYIILLNPEFITKTLVGTCLILVLFSSISGLAKEGQLLFLFGILAADYILVIVINSLTSDGILDQLTRILFLIEIIFISYFIFYYRSEIIRLSTTGHNDYIHHAFYIFLELLDALRNKFRT